MEEIKTFYKLDGKDYGYRRWRKNSIAKFDFNATEKAITNFLEGKKYGSVLEVGCGPGTWTNYLCEHSQNVTAVDISDTMLKQAKENVNSDKVEFIEGNILNINFKKKYDLIFSIRAFEYFEDQRQFLLNCYNLLNDNGEIFIITKTKASYWYGRSKIRKFLNRFAPFLFYYEKKELSKEHFDNMGNFKQNRLFTSEFRKLLVDAGFTDLSVSPVIVRPPIFMRGKSEIPLIPPLLEKPTLALLKPIDILLSKFSLFTIFAESYSITGKKK